MPQLPANVMDWLQNRVLRGLTDRLDKQARDLAEVRRRLNRMEKRMSALTDWLADFRSQVNDQTNRISGQLADLQARLDAGDANAVAEVNSALTPIITDLQAIGSGGHQDPLPAPPPNVPTDDTGAVVDESGGTV